MNKYEKSENFKKCEKSLNLPFFDFFALFGKIHQYEILGRIFPKKFRTHIKN